MPYASILIVVGIVGLVFFFFKRKGAYYDKIFSDDHYTEVGNWLLTVLKLGPVDEPNWDNSTIFQSTAGCGFTFTRDIEEKDRIHIAISQIGNPTTHALSNRFAFLILQILNTNKAVADFYYTKSTVHHVLLEKEVQGEWLTNEVASAVAEMKSYRSSIPFRFQGESSD